MLFTIFIVILTIFFIIAIPIGILFYMILRGKINLSNMNYDMFSSFNFKDFTNGFEDEYTSKPNINNTTIDKSEALEILGLESNASKENINKAYHKLMQKFHPDKSGSNYFAQKLNMARECLLNNK